MLEYQTRVVDEQAILNEKASALYNFLVTKTFVELPEIDQDLLKQQYYAMMVYSSILKQRIARF